MSFTWRRSTDRQVLNQLIDWCLAYNKKTMQIMILLRLGYTRTLRVWVTVWSRIWNRLGQILWRDWLKLIMYYTWPTRCENMVCTSSKAKLLKTRFSRNAWMAYVAMRGTHNVTYWVVQDCAHNYTQLRHARLLTDNQLKLPTLWRLAMITV